MRIIDWIMKVPTLEAKPLIERLKNLRRSTLVVILMLVAIPGILLSLGFVHLVGTQKLYCLNCHVNQRDTNFWLKSAVHPDINCARCHDVSGGGTLDGVFHYSFSAKEDVVSALCVDCHKKDLDRPVGIMASDKKRAKNELILIPHEMHINDLGIKCTYCHYNVFHERRPPEFATYRPKMETCYTCHDEETMACSSCHPEGMPSRIPMSGNVGGGKVSYAGGGYGPVTFSHDKHVGNGLPCEACHPAVFGMGEENPPITMARIFGGKDCGHCHNGMGAFASDECARCHRGGRPSGGELKYKVEAFGPVMFSHENHIAMGLECSGCHTSLFGFAKTSGRITMDAINNGRACGTCHDGERAFSADACDSCHSMG